ncbi:efflux RND transporter permease subunit [Bradyrhizobium sp. SRL28]|uniref:efflux RND transporter permease subunit n=1 Tax=Bradyrhizobium sp. SRL28 TaxID=2836178 RepID=UPI001BDEEBD4|nr:efflux RND transporter permease subunit [Bradyrhizobium sp. SRL28]MBT1512756.1 efflux RND transporter permease subunit [Bradyrhizobium sp. SRL28]
MNLVSFALRRPISLLTIVVAVALVGFLAIGRMSRDIFPDLGVPVLYVAQPYGGMDPAQMEGFIVNYYEYHFLYITGIEHVESKSIQGVGLIKLQFHRGTDMAQATAETVGYVDRARAFMPTGTVPPFVMRFDGGSVPVGDLVFSSKTKTVAELQDAALFKVRPLFATLPGVSAPPPFGSSQRTILVSLDPDKLRSYNMSPDEVVQALGAGNTVSPSGNVRIGDLMPMVPVNSVVGDFKGLNNIPIRSRGTQTIFIRDVGSVEDGADIQTGYALVNGRRTVYIPVTKRADASTLAVVQAVKANLPRFQSVLPDDVEVSYQFDQSAYVTRAIQGLFVEGALGAVLTGLMVLLFLRDWRSSLVVVLNIPLAILASVTALWVSGQTINIMTLGGLALAVGILVDEATVTIENIHTRLADGRGLARAASEATAETTLPRFVAMLCILAVFIPAVFMTGAAHNLFVPLALAVGFAMVGSYLLSSTFVPVLSVWLLRNLSTYQKPQETFFDRLRARYDRFLRLIMRRRRIVLSYLIISGAIIFVVGGSLGTEIFPSVDTGQLQLHLRAPAGTRIERTEQIALQTLDVIKREVGPDNVEISLGFVGTQPPNYPINTIYLWSSGSEEAVLQVQLKRGAGIGIEDLKERLRQKLPQELAGVRFSFEPSDIVSRVMSFGAPTPIEVAVGGPNLADSRQFAEELRAKLAQVPTLRDLGFEQELDYPTVKVTVDRERAGVLGVTTDDVAKSVVAGTSSSRYTSANYWADPKSGIGYQVQVEIPEHKMNSLEEVKNLPITRRSGQQIDLRNVAGVTDGTALGEYDRYNMQRMLTLSANIHGEDLGRAAARVQQAINDTGKPPDRVNVTVRGQVQPMAEMFGGLRLGLLMAVGVILLVLAANFQSLRLSLAVGLTIPAVIAGVVLMLWLTRTTLNIQSFMGAIMAIGVAVANAILLVTFAERSRVEGRESWEAAIEGARSRLRPILMTSFAMLAGMVPMALGLGEGGEQSAPLGRAVIGGLLGATCATLIILPAILATLQSRHTRISASLDPDDPQSRYFESEPRPRSVSNGDGRAEHHAHAAE